jgi:hypothetical protein
MLTQGSAERINGAAATAVKTDEIRDEHSFRLSSFLANPPASTGGFGVQEIFPAANNRRDGRPGRSGILEAVRKPVVQK